MNIKNMLRFIGIQMAKKRGSDNNKILPPKPMPILHNVNTSFSFDVSKKNDK